MTERLPLLAAGTYRRSIAWVVGLAIAYDIAELGLQLRDWFGSPISSTSVGEYSGSIAVALCVIALIFIRRMTQNRRVRTAAVAAAIVFAVLTVDNIFSIHERMNNDDYLAVILWVIAGGVLLKLLRLERPGRWATTAICSGFLLHGLAALADGADGGIFTINMITPVECAWWKEIFALAYLGLYVAGFSNMLVTRKRIEESTGALPSALRCGKNKTIVAEVLAGDQELLELEAWYWAWRSHVEAAETDEGADQMIDQMLAVIDKLTDTPSQSIVGIAAKLRVFQDVMETVTHFKRPEMSVEAHLLDTVVSEVNRFAET